MSRDSELDLVGEIFAGLAALATIWIWLPAMIGIFLFRVSYKYLVGG
jgi:hypothetical protein